MQEQIILPLAVFISSILSGMAGVGGGVTLLAFMAPLYPPAVLIPLHGSIQVISNCSRVSLSLKKVDWKIFFMFTAGAALGALAGVPITLTLPPVLSTVIIAMFILLFTWMPKWDKPLDFPGKFTVVGAVASFLSLFVGATGPLTAPFFVHSHLTKETFAPTKASGQIPIHAFKVIVYSLSGFVIAQWLPQILLSLPIAIAGNWLGKILAERIEEKTYKRVIQIIITLLVFRMLIRLILPGVK